MVSHSDASGAKPYLRQRDDHAGLSRGRRWKSWSVAGVASTAAEHFLWVGPTRSPGRQHRNYYPQCGGAGGNNKTESLSVESAANSTISLTSGGPAGTLTFLGGHVRAGR